MDYRFIGLEKTIDKTWGMDKYDFRNEIKLYAIGYKAVKQHIRANHDNMSSNEFRIWIDMRDFYHERIKTLAIELRNFIHPYFIKHNFDQVYYNSLP